MNNKTPKFNEAMEKYFSELKLDKQGGQERVCRVSGERFYVRPEDIEFYKKMQVPLPTLCPHCRMQRRMAHRVLLPIFYKKRCSAPEHGEKVISFYSEKNPIKIYDDDYYISDKWEATDFAVDYNRDESFFEQFLRFKLSVPHQASSRDLKSVNCKYIISGSESKNCYYSSAPMNSENVHFSMITINTKNSQDVGDVDNSEYCYDSLYLNHCYKVKYSRESSHCVNSAFLFDCRDCADCFMSSNLRHKKYVFYNQQLSKSEYQRKMAEIDLGDRMEVERLKDDFQKIIQDSIHKNLRNEKVERSVGNLLRECKDCYKVHRVYNSENIAYVSNGHGVRDSMDLYGAINSEESYESSGIGDGVSKIKFSLGIRGGLELEYCTDCVNCEYCFASVGLKNKKFCIFNKQYSEEEYWQKVDEIKTKMLEDGEYGEFFPIKNSVHPYQDTIASAEGYFLTEEEVKSKGYHEYAEIKSELDLSGDNVLLGKDLPNNIKEVEDSILDKVIICEKTEKPFKIVNFELKFYQQEKIPLPTVHPLERIRSRVATKYTFHIWEDICARCGSKMFSAHNPKKKLKVYCEKCYNEALN